MKDELSLLRATLGQMKRENLELKKENEKLEC